MKKLSKLGVVLALIYMFICVFFVFNGLSADDDKGKFVLLQLPIALQMAIVDSLGGGWLLDKLSWITAYVSLGGATMVFLYSIGGVLDGTLLNKKRGN